MVGWSVNKILIKISVMARNGRRRNVEGKEFIGSLIPTQQTNKLQNNYNPLDSVFPPIFILIPNS